MEGGICNERENGRGECRSAAVRMNGLAPALGVMVNVGCEEPDCGCEGVLIYADRRYDDVMGVRA